MNINELFFSQEIDFPQKIIALNLLLAVAFSAIFLKMKWQSLIKNLFYSKVFYCTSREDLQKVRQ